MVRTTLSAVFAIPLCITLLAGARPSVVTAGDPPSLTPRVLVTMQGTPFIDWEGEESVAVLMLPNTLGAADNLYLAGTESEWTIDDYLALNRPDLTEEQRLEIAALLEDSLVGVNLVLDADNVRHITQRGLSKPFVYRSSADGTPTQAEVAEAGPEGNVLVLGAFFVRVKTEASPTYLPHIGTDHAYITDPDAGNWDYRIQVAIGWFK